MTRSPNRFALPTALTVTLVGQVACSSPTHPGACVSNFEPPADASAPAQGVRPQIDVSPCPMQLAGPDWFCMTASGCSVEYTGGVNAMVGAPIELVSCPTTNQCLWGLDASGQPIYGVCPQVEVQPQQCTNTFRFNDPGASYFNCNGMRAGCTLGSGEQGQQVAYVTRQLTGAVDSSPCPTTCTPFA